MKMEHHYQREDGKYVLSVPVTYQMFGRTEIIVDSLEKAVDKLNDEDYLDEMKLPDEPEYVEASYEVDYAILAEEVEEDLSWKIP